MKTAPGFGILIAAIVAFVGVTPGLAIEGEILGGQPEARNEIHATSPSTPSSIYLNVEGKLKEIQGDIYILEGAGADQPIRVQVGKDTAFPNGQKKPGQSIHALVSAQSGHALIIR